MVARHINKAFSQATACTGMLGVGAGRAADIYHYPDEDFPPVRLETNEDRISGNDAAFFKRHWVKNIDMLRGLRSGLDTGCTDANGLHRGMRNTDYKVSSRYPTSGQ
ncbi:uncharacterized protein EV420DRAFT_1476630 [Desarmillaria tabescens]|uniref:Uncharacterized protein n=1 Tax=Armillaria tabescens TaxID=1929756 RepID=A0AA39TT54_ARMTA|nr:uncharacterized protein EV420DRAFT_1476630 [Desarmillaria tabescens]KAK0462839.1 hypothetical protein EV420DRAFT_1476630 [Desarmillaria tabescens]